MLKQLATALIALSTLVPSAKAETELDHTKISAYLHSLGVTTEVGDCGSTEHGNRLGTYDPVSNHLCLSEKIEDGEMLDEVILHETIHLVQDCIEGGIATDQMGSVTAFLSGGDIEKEKELDKKIYAKLVDEDKILHVDKWAGELGNSQYIEREAYAFENDPKLVLNLLSMCVPQLINSNL